MILKDGGEGGGESALPCHHNCDATLIISVLLVIASLPLLLLRAQLSKVPPAVANVRLKTFDVGSSAPLFRGVRVFLEPSQHHPNCSAGVATARHSTAPSTAHSPAYHNPDLDPNSESSRPHDMDKEQRQEQGMGQKRDVKLGEQRGSNASMPVQQPAAGGGGSGHGETGFVPDLEFFGPMGGINGEAGAGGGDGAQRLWMLVERLSSLLERKAPLFLRKHLGLHRRAHHQHHHRVHAHHHHQQHHQAESSHGQSAGVAAMAAAAAAVAEGGLDPSCARLVVEVDLVFASQDMDIALSLRPQDVGHSALPEVAVSLTELVLAGQLRINASLTADYPFLGEGQVSRRLLSLSQLPLHTC